MPYRYAVFVVNLLQDVNILRPLVYLASQGLGLRTEFLVSKQFLARDKSGTWRAELDRIGSRTGTPRLIFRDTFQAVTALEGKSGALVAASESDVPGHASVHELFAFAHSGFVKITLQHGFECVGFLHNRAHDVAHGDKVAFAADIVCGWCEGSRLTSMTPSQRSKLYVAGPPALLQLPRPACRSGGEVARGLVCENLHSVRLNVGGDFKSDFIATFEEFCDGLAAQKRSVTLRPHPGGQYVVDNNVRLPPNVMLNNHPIYKVDLAGYAYGISAPSSVLIDMVLAGIPTAVWRDRQGTMDAANYDGLTEVCGVEEWLEFSQEAEAHPERFVERQQRFLERQQMPTDPQDVYRRFAGLLDQAANAAAPASRTGRRARAASPERIMFVANSNLPTLQICFTRPLAALVEAGEMQIDLITEPQLNAIFGDNAPTDDVLRWLRNMFDTFVPTTVIFCRYSGLYAEHIHEVAREFDCTTIFHIDDDLLNVPASHGKGKYEFHNNPERTARIRHLLDRADLVYCSTAPLKEKLHQAGGSAPIRNGRINCFGKVRVPASQRPVSKIGYTGWLDHIYDLQQLLPVLVVYLRRHPEVQFELFGTIPKPPELDEFGQRIKIVPAVPDYDVFLGQLSSLGWDIGICPLAPTPFNMLKGNNKWIEFTSVGAAVIASRNTVYDECCSDSCGILATTPDEWLTALEDLTRDPVARLDMVRRAQERLASDYSIEQLRAQVLEMISTARSLRLGTTQARSVATSFETLG